MRSSPRKALHHWGGAKDGEIHYPIRWDTLFLIDGRNNAAEGEIYLAAPILFYE
jgi:hypothetical protein